MIKILGVLVLVSASFGPVYGQTSKPAASGTAETLKQLERDWTEAMKSHDVDKLSQILADDWSGLGYDGAKLTKKEFLNDVKSGASKIESVEFGPMDVKVMGTVAVVQGSDTEKSSTKGKGTSGKWLWMDVFMNRNGQWQAVRSQSAMAK